MSFSLQQVLVNWGPLVYRQENFGNSSGWDTLS